MEHLAYIPFKKIERIEIYENIDKLTLKQIVSAKNPDYAITGGFYLYSWEPTCHLKSNGVVLASDPYTYRGYSWDRPDNFAMRLVPDTGAFANHYACCTLICQGKSYPGNYNSDVAGTRGRTAIGIKGDNLVLYASKDGTSHAKTPEKLRDYLIGKGLDSMIMGDGGGKVNFYGDGVTMQGSAKSQNLFLVYLKKEMIMVDPRITLVLLKNNPRQKAHVAMDKTGYMQHSTGTPGAKAKDFMATWDKSTAQAEAEFVIDDTGIYQLLDLNIRTWHGGGKVNNTHVGCEVCEPLDTRLIPVNWTTLKVGSQGDVVKLMQEELNRLGYNVGKADGIFGNGTKSGVMAFQKAVGVSVDGIVGRGTLAKFQSDPNSKLNYPVAKNQAYFEDVYDKAVYTCGYVLGELGVKNVNSVNVLSHSEGYKQGVASNHADVEHWWSYHGKTMSNFRNDVKKYMESGKLPFEDAQSTPTPDPAPGEFEIAWDKACDMGLFDGTNPTGNVTRNQLAVVLYRAGIVK